VSVRTPRRLDEAEDQRVLPSVNQTAHTSVGPMSVTGTLANPGLEDGGAGDRFGQEADRPARSYELELLLQAGHLRAAHPCPREDEGRAGRLRGTRPEFRHIHAPRHRPVRPSP